MKSDVVKKTINLNLLFTIIIPVYNRQKGLNLLLDALSQTINAGAYGEIIELIVVDDCSDTPITIASFPCAIQLVKNEKNSGAPFSRKKGFELSKGKFVHFHDSDDLITIDWLSEIIAKLKSDSRIDFLLTGREVHDKNTIMIKSQKFFHKNTQHPQKIKDWLIYQNCIGPLGGVTFSRELLKKVRFYDLPSCQDWQMYIDAMDYAKVLRSVPDIQFIFNRDGTDRISNDARKKIVGHLQLAKVTSKQSVFKRNIRLFYLYSCRQHIYEYERHVLRFYNKNKWKIFLNFLAVSIFWRLSRNGIIKKS